MSAFVLALAMVMARRASAQEVSSFTDLAHVLEPGQHVIVRENDGHTLRATVVRIDDDRLQIRWRRWIFALRERTLTSTTVESLKVEDSDWNGALLGAGAGALAGWLLVDKQCGRDLCLAPAGSYLGAVMGVGIGGAIDRSINRIVYQARPRTRITVVPVVTADRVGFSARAAF